MDLGLQISECVIKPLIRLFRTQQTAKTIFHAVELIKYMKTNIKVWPLTGPTSKSKS